MDPRGPGWAAFFNVASSSGAAPYMTYEEARDLAICRAQAEQIEILTAEEVLRRLAQRGAGNMGGLNRERQKINKIKCNRPAVSVSSKLGLSCFSLLSSSVCLVFIFFLVRVLFSIVGSGDVNRHWAVGGEDEMRLRDSLEAMTITDLQSR